MLTGSRIERVHRVGKTIVCDLDVGADKAQGELAGASRHDRAAAGLACRGGGAEAHAPDREPRVRQGDPLCGCAALRTHLGGAPFLGKRRVYWGRGKSRCTIGLAEFTALFAGRKTPIKAALLNQKLLHGVGNIYADESLFRAGIRPKRQAGRLTRDELKRLHAALKVVLKHAIKLGGSSVSDYVDADGVRGFFQLQHKVYMRTGEPCMVCRTPIKKITIGGRSTHFCPKCQT